MTYPTLSPTSTPHKPDPHTQANVDAIAPPPPTPANDRLRPTVAPSKATARTRPPRQPLPTPVLDPAKPMLKLGLDVHMEFIMAVAQKGHTQPQAPRRFTRQELVNRVKQWVAEGYQVFSVHESCGFGFILHRELVAAGAQSFLITPIALNGPRINASSSALSASNTASSTLPSQT